jgi:hypothetical protein
VVYQARKAAEVVQEPVEKMVLREGLEIQALQVNNVRRRGQFFE